MLAEVKRTFNPEFVNRIDEIIVFEALTDDDLRRILGLLLEELNRNLADRGHSGSTAVGGDRLDRRGDVQGSLLRREAARRALQRFIEDPMAEQLIAGRLGRVKIEAYLAGGAVAFRPAGVPEASHSLA